MPTAGFNVHMHFSFKPRGSTQVKNTLQREVLHTCPSQSLLLPDELSESDEEPLEEESLPLLLLLSLSLSLSLPEDDEDEDDEDDSAFLMAKASCSADFALISLGAFFKNKRKSSLHNTSPHRPTHTPKPARQAAQP
jgi:hypothetical protein